MIKNVEVYGLEQSILRSGYPMQVGDPETLGTAPIANKNELSRGIKLANVPSGSGHDNFLKGIIVQFDLQYPEYFSPQLQRYSWIEIVSSQSKMHKLTSRELVEEDFTKGLYPIILELINKWIREYNSESDINLKKVYFQKIITNLPSGYLKWMGISTNYLQLKTIYKQRRNHKLAEWHEFCDWIETLPEAKLITG